MTTSQKSPLRFHLMIGAASSAGAADRMVGSPARCLLATRPLWPRWWQPCASGLAAVLALLVPSMGRAQGILEPGNSSLAPIDREAFRQQYGQEGLFRLRLGVAGGGCGRAASQCCSGSSELPCRLLEQLAPEAAL